MADVTTKVRIGRVGQRRQVVIPREILDNLNMREGDFVAVAQRGDSVVIQRKAVTDPDDVLVPPEGAAVKKAGREVKQGRFVTLAQRHHDLARKGSNSLTRSAGPAHAHPERYRRTCGRPVQSP